MKILMATMSMGYGGAETHIAELSRELCRRGHSVFVASAGGAYVDAILKCGAHHVDVPLDSKSPISVMKSIKILSRLIERENFDIVHAHARIPAFICGKLKKKYGFLFVTTAHFDSRADTVFSRFTDWGDFVFCISEDIAENLIKNYSYPKERVGIVRNGIDTEVFSPERSADAIREKYSLGDAPVVMYLGRLGDDSYLPAKLLIESFDKINRRFPNVRILIVGDGKQKKSLLEMGERLNVKEGREAVVFTGPTSDASSYIAACNVFVGPSRSAMEALSCGKPVIVAGTFGRLGLFSSDISEECLRTNFCCRGSALPTAEWIADEVLYVLSLGGEKRVLLSEYGRSFVKKNYSVGNMTDVYEKKYVELLSERRKNIVICGYYGYENAGDEAMLSVLVTFLADNGNVGKICVMSANPDETREKYGVDAVDRFDIHAVKRIFSQSDIMIFGGGNILQDKTSTHSLLYYTLMIKLAKSRACRVALVSNGIGPITKNKNIKRVLSALENADYISLRDTASLKFAEELLPKREIFGTSDLVCAVEKVERTQNKLFDGMYFIVFPKKIKGFSFETMADFCRDIKKKYSFYPVFCPMHKNEDDMLCEKLASSTGGKICYENSAENISGLLAGSVFSVCMRLHGVIFSLMEKCPMMGISDDGKMSAFISSLGIPECAFFPPDVSPSDIFVAAEKMIANRADIRDSLGFETGKHREDILSELQRLDRFISNGSVSQ